MFGLELGGDRSSGLTPTTASSRFNPCLGWNWGGTLVTYSWASQRRQVSILVWVGIGGGRRRTDGSRARYLEFQSLFGLELGGDRARPCPDTAASKGFNPCLGWNWGGTQATTRWPGCRRCSFNPCLGWNWGGTGRGGRLSEQCRCFNPCLGWNWGGTQRRTLDSLRAQCDPSQVSILVWVGIGGGHVCHGHRDENRGVSILVWVGIGGGQFLIGNFHRRAEGFNPCLGWNWGGTGTVSVYFSETVRFNPCLGWNWGGTTHEAEKLLKVDTCFNPCLGWNWGGTGDAKSSIPESRFQSLFGLELGGDMSELVPIFEP